jgi:S-adenosylmethionine:tRNA ribosyltransferase-isomerase
MRTSDFDYQLPPELIAQRPAARRDGSRLLVLERSTGRLSHRTFSDLPEYLRPDDLLIVNDSRVLPARLHGRRSSGGAVELLLLRERAPGEWYCLARPAKRVRPSDRLVFGEGAIVGTVLAAGEDGQRLVAFTTADDTPFADALRVVGEVPLPPYIHERPPDPERYQTVYARSPGSVAAPTAGLHFTPELLARLRGSGVRIEPVTLHVGLGTFRPVQVEDPREHHMHAEFGILPEDTAEALAIARTRGGRVIAVGTTAMRVLETAAREAQGGPWSGWTDIFIYPGFEFRACDALITNFHLPRSTLLMLVSAFAGKALIDRAYAEAIAERYRFFSFGDAMLII